MNIIKKYADNTRYNSISNKFRRNRFKIFKSIISCLPKPVKILDVGGTENFWKQMGFSGNTETEITLLNTEKEFINDNKFKFIECNAKDLSRVNNKKYDIIFSNSVIEHVGGLEEQKIMADEITGTGKLFFLQTPNYYFPFEPHFLFPCFQFFPYFLKVFLITRFNLGYFKKAKNRNEAAELIDSIHLLTHKKLSVLFPEGKILRERFIFFSKSFIVTNSTLLH